MWYTSKMMTKYLTPQLFSRLALAIVFIWFGLLKVFGVSPAHELVTDLLAMTLPFIPAEPFNLFLGVWETGIGVLWLFPKLTKQTFWIMQVQMFTTFGPLVFLPNASWQHLAVPTLVGQYIIKNVVLVALAYWLYTNHTNQSVASSTHLTRQ